MQLALGEGTAHGTANPGNISGHLILRGRRCKQCRNWRRDGEQSQGGDLQASANLLCVHADGCSFSLSPQNWQASTDGGFNLIFTAGRLSPACVAATGLKASWGPRLGWWPYLGGAKGPRIMLRVGHRTPLLWWASLSGVWQSPALEVVTLQLSKLPCPCPPEGSRVT